MTAGKVIAAFINKGEIDFLGAATMENNFLEFFWQLFPWRLQGKFIMLGQ